METELYEAAELELAAADPPPTAPVEPEEPEEEQVSPPVITNFKLTLPSVEARRRFPLIKGRLTPHEKTINASNALMQRAYDATRTSATTLGEELAKEGYSQILPKQVPIPSFVGAGAQHTTRRVPLGELGNQGTTALTARYLGP